MNNTRITNPFGLLSLAVVVFLVLAIGFIAWLNFAPASIDFSGLTLRQVNRPETFVLDPSGANAQGLAIYHQSERGLASPSANTEGMDVYHRSERGLSPFAQSNDVGLNQYWQSERGSLSNEAGLAFYYDSERNTPLTESGSTEEGMEIYYASERER